MNVRPRTALAAALTAVALFGAAPSASADPMGPVELAPACHPACPPAPDPKPEPKPVPEGPEDLKPCTQDCPAPDPEPNPDLPKGPDAFDSGVDPCVHDCPTDPEPGDQVEDPAPEPSPEPSPDLPEQPGKDTVGPSPKAVLTPPASGGHTASTGAALPTTGVGEDQTSVASVQDGPSPMEWFALNLALVGAGGLLVWVYLRRRRA